ncbi:hypothetical protein [Streptomyces sp. NBC_00162]|uniref:hypothetical protein n=1 Tax=Streptomyces sp. NBC_00162 TaxID=2903629 RepID=UPI00214CDCF7|nr:hypothetical protein [Streptomyces sp. NBC_00162]UUU43066.1 hypothetical protein JIW86_32185 [Streptomyces sp. NBC_00162]
MSNRPIAFEQRLKAELLVRMPDRPAPGPAPVRRSPARRYRLSLALGAVAATAAGLIALPVLGDSGGASPAHAYTLTRADDGSILVELFHPDGLPGLERELRGLGFSVAMVYGKPKSECPTYAGAAIDVPGEPLTSANENGIVLRINAKTLPAGHTLILEMPSETRLARHPGAMGFGVVEASKVPPCVPEDPPPPADDGTQPHRTLSPDELEARRKEEARLKEIREKYRAEHPDAPKG